MPSTSTNFSITGAVSRVVPAAAGADRDVERDGKIRGAAHLRAHQRRERLALARGHLEDQLVVDLQEHARAQALGEECGLD